MEFKIEDTIVDTGKAAQKWDSRNTSSQGQDEKLYRSDQGRYYIVRTSQGQGSLPSAEFVSKDAATRWILRNGYELPTDLKISWSGG
jgi:hypothetical protein